MKKLKKKLSELMKKIKNRVFIVFEIIVIIISAIFCLIVPSYLYIKLFIAISITIFLGLGVGYFLDCIVPKPPPPTGITKNKWKAIFYPVVTGKWIGFFERLLILISFLIPEYTILAGWFAFKVAAKWESWSNIVKVPDNIEKTPSLIWFQAKKRIGSFILSRFLIGTLINTFIGIIGAYSGEYYCKFMGWLCQK